MFRAWPPPDPPQALGVDPLRSLPKPKRIPDSLQDLKILVARKKNQISDLLRCLTDQVLQGYLQISGSPVPEVLLLELLDVE